MVKVSELRPRDDSGNNNNGQGNGQQRNRQGRNNRNQGDRNRDQRPQQGSDRATVRADELEPAPVGGGRNGRGSSGGGRSSGGGEGGNTPANEALVTEQSSMLGLGPTSYQDATGTTWQSRKAAEEANQRALTDGYQSSAGFSNAANAGEGSGPTGNLDQFYDAMFPTPEAERQGGAMAAAASGGWYGAGVGSGILGPIGSVAGGILGAGAGYSAVYAKQQFFDEEVNASAPEMARETFDTMYNEGLYSMGFMSAGPAVASVGARVLGQMGIRGNVDEHVRQSKEMMDEFRNRGLESSPVLTGRTSFARAMPNVTGLLPFGGGKTLRRRLSEDDAQAGRIMQEEVDKILRQDLDADAPNPTLHSLGINTQRMAEQSTTHWNRLSRENYRAFDDLVAQKGDPEIADVRPARVAAMSGIGKAIGAGQGTKRGGGQPLNRKNLRRNMEALMGEHQGWRLLDRISRVGDTNKVSDLRGFQKEVSDMIRDTDPERNGQLRNILTQAKNELDNSLQALPDDELRRSITHANQFHSYQASIFQNSDMAKEFARANPSAFRQGFDDTNNVLPEDQIARNILATKSPASVRSLREIVGNRRTRELGAMRVQEALDDAKTVDQDNNEVIDWAKMRENLDLDNSSGRNTLGEFFEPSRFGQLSEDRQEAILAAQRMGLETKEADDLLQQFNRMSDELGSPNRTVSPEDINQERNQVLRTMDNLSQIGMNLQSVPIRNPSDFLARRLTLSGSVVGSSAVASASAGGAAAGTAGAGVGLLGSYLPVIAVSNGAHRLLANKRVQRNLDKVLEGNPLRGDYVDDTRRFYEPPVGPRGYGTSARTVNKSRERQDLWGSIWGNMSPSERSEVFDGLGPAIQENVPYVDTVEDAFTEDEAMKDFQVNYERLERKRLNSNPDGEENSN